MSLLSLTSITDSPKPDARLEGSWTDRVEEPTDLAVTYQVTTRSAPLLVDFDGSTEESAHHKTGNSLFETVVEEGEATSRFLTNERFWNNEVRKTALETGLEHYVPRILFLLRPETAITSCLHFLAKELGGITDFEHQRDFIFNNPGLLTLLRPFWTKVLENYWSVRHARRKGMTSATSRDLTVTCDDTYAGESSLRPLPRRCSTTTSLFNPLWTTAKMR